MARSKQGQKPKKSAVNGIGQSNGKPPRAVSTQAACTLGQKSTTKLHQTQGAKSRVTKANGQMSGVTKATSQAKKTKNTVQTRMLGKTNKSKVMKAVLKEAATRKMSKASVVKQALSSLSDKAKGENIVAKKPPKFSWIEEGVVAGQGRPTQHGHVQFLVDNGFKYIVTLTLNKPRALREYPGEGLTWVHIPIQDETPPTLAQTTEFVDLVMEAKSKKQGAVSTHCAWGRGRTGTMLACYLVRAMGTSADKAIDRVRGMRPGSIDTEKQVNSVKEYAASLAK